MLSAELIEQEPTALTPQDLTPDLGCYEAGYDPALLGGSHTLADLVRASRNGGNPRCRETGLVVSCDCSRWWGTRGARVWLPCCGKERRRVQNRQVLVCPECRVQWRYHYLDTGDHVFVSLGVKAKKTKKVRIPRSRR
jgi:hypothetical protein